GDALLAQFGAQQVGVLRHLLALHHHAALVAALPDELHHRVQAAGLRLGPGLADCGSACGHGGFPQSLVTRLISIRLVTPCLTLSNAERRRSRTPLTSDASVICWTLPPASTICWISSVIGITW